MLFRSCDASHCNRDRDHEGYETCAPQLAGRLRQLLIPFTDSDVFVCFQFVGFAQDCLLYGFGAAGNRFALPPANHVFLPGHRIMVQVQSSWFPLYDRNPQTFVSNIFWAKPGDYKKATQRVYHAPGETSAVELPVVAE